jgi:general secretion pathway protein D
VYQNVYVDADVVKAVPWFKDASNVVIAGKSRPLSKDYGQVSDVVRTTTSNIDSPTFSQRRLRSTISVQSGSTIMLGGLIEHSDNRDNSGIPVLHEIPVIGGLFGTKNVQAGRRELIMLMTPFVVGTDRQARDLTVTMEHEFENALNSAPMLPVHAPRLP